VLVLEVEIFPISYLKTGYSTPLLWNRMYSSTLRAILKTSENRSFPLKSNFLILLYIVMNLEYCTFAILENLLNK
ncbi:hypothetical protein DRO58_06440, partial [Candidatus Bathyarchaeota archaeon]